VLTAGGLQVESHVVVGEVAARVAEFAAGHAARDRDGTRGLGDVDGALPGPVARGAPHLTDP
jgi:hypothetical protein